MRGSEDVSCHTAGQLPNAFEDAVWQQHPAQTQVCAAMGEQSLPAAIVPPTTHVELDLHATAQAPGGTIFDRAPPHSEHHTATLKLMAAPDSGQHTLPRHIEPPPMYTQANQGGEGCAPNQAKEQAGSMQQGRARYVTNTGVPGR